MKRRFYIQRYHFFTADLTKEIRTPEFRDKEPGFTSAIHAVTELPQNLNIPEEIKPSWNKLCENKKLWVSYICNSENWVINYQFFTTETLCIEEFGSELKLTTNEAYISAGRTYSKYLKLGLSEYSKLSILSHLKKQGYSSAHVFSRKNNTSPQYVNIKTGMYHSYTYIIIKILNYKFGCRIRA